MHMKRSLRSEELVEGDERRAGDHLQTAASSLGMARRRSLGLGACITPCA
uniref:Uncharacterized protein n=1 Tax=Arundo donax TaxID=35708 RepID=A0A0A9HH13_ARUDO